MEKKYRPVLPTETYRMAAMIKSIKLGFKIQKDFPQVKDLYREYKPASVITKDLDLVNFYSTSKKICESAVCYALKGYDHEINVIRDKIQSYTGLLSRKEFSEIAHGNLKQSAQKTGKQLRKDKKGVFGLSDQEKIDIGRKAITRLGRTPYSEKELDYIKKLCNDSDFIYNSGTNEGNIKASEICKKVNKRFHKSKSIRNACSISKVVKRKKFRYQDDDQTKNK